MKIDHVAMYVANLEAAKEFFMRFFGATPNEMYHNSRTGLRTYFLTFPNGGKLEIMTRPEVVTDNKLIYGSGLSHISFAVGSKENVDLLTEQLRDSGYEVLSGPRITGDGYYESCVSGFENNLIEITE